MTENVFNKTHHIYLKKKLTFVFVVFSGVGCISENIFEVVRYDVILIFSETAVFKGAE